MSDSPLEQIREVGIVPVIAIDDVQSALPLADALLEGGINIIEITFRSAAAASVIAEIVSKRPEMLVGAGTVLTVDNAKAASAAGAKFALAPGCREPIVECARNEGLLFMPGVCTPSDVERALAMGCTTVKFFPVEAMGGLKIIDAVYGPFRHTGLRFVPSGGVGPDNLAAYIAHDAVAAVGGTWLAKADDLTAGDWDGIRRRAAEAVAIIKGAR